MQIHWRDDLTDGFGNVSVIPSKVKNVVKRYIDCAFNQKYLENPFIVNPTKWFEYSNNLLKPRVVNKAEHLSYNFHQGLKEIGWKIDHVISDQEIDAFKIITVDNCPGMTISQSSLSQCLATLPIDDKLLSTVSDLYSNHFCRNFFQVTNRICGSFFEKVCNNVKIRVGLEFETGNIASSFRAILKLNNLYSDNKIDVGVFVCSNSKSAATKIWPSSNRNGSIDELMNRNFLSNVKFPILLCGFEPDGWDASVGYLEKTSRLLIEKGELEKKIMNVRNRSGVMTTLLYSKKLNLYCEEKSISCNAALALF